MIIDMNRIGIRKAGVFGTLLVISLLRLLYRVNLNNFIYNGGIIY